MQLDLDAVTPAELRRRAGVKWTTHPPGVIGAFIAEMDFGTAPEVLEALHRSVDAVQFGYLSEPLSRELATACCDWQLAEYGWAANPDWTFPAPHVLRGLEVAVNLYSPPGSPVILPTPAYMPFFTIPAELGRATIDVPMLRTADGQHRFDLDGIRRAFEAGGGVLILCNPYNPLGRVFSATELAELAEVVEACGGRVFADEIHAPLVYAPNRHVPYASVSEQAAGHSITATSASKAWNIAGLQCASIILTNEIDVTRWDDVGLLASHGASTLGVVANTHAYRSGKPWLDAVVGQLDANRSLLAELLEAELPGVRYDPPEGTYLAWLDCRALGLGDDPAGFFLTHAGVALTEGTLCGAAGHCRLNFATTPSLLEEIVGRMARAVRSLGRS